MRTRAAGSTLPRRQLARHLRELRQGTGMSIAEVAKRIERGYSTLQRLESGTADRIRLWDIEALCQVLGADATMTEALKGLAQQGNQSNWWHEYGDLIPPEFDVFIGLESAAARLTSHHELVPGLLQTPSYAEALFRAAYPDEGSSEIARRVEMRLHRQRLVTRDRSPAAVDTVLGESALHRLVGGQTVMSHQLRHLADISTRPNVTIRVLPFRAGIPLGEVPGPFTILDFESLTKSPAEPSVVYAENISGDMYLERPESVRRYRLAFETAARVALNPQDSRDLLRQVARR
ncbi:helix-turn-helix domain-containing protein [Nocardia sp. NPDC057227]|uniref:helix-turn-helix domain-containing protein n=1 Tax=Nocardia sp. NPDC057227 TaxID=3346056 RepID=UPI003624D8E8